jgi:predicted transcriptional regulator
MKERVTRLPDAELAIMKIIWAKGGEVTSAEISAELTGKKEWAATTVLNFLARLADRGFLSVTRSGKTNLYAPLVNEQDYLQRESKSFLERMHGNSLKSLVAALYVGEAVSADDLAELKNFIDEQARQMHNNNEGERTNG